jgi:iron uptake system component EfeO
MASPKLVICAASTAVLCLLPGCSNTPARPNSATVPSSGITITVSEHVCGSGWRHPSTGLLAFHVHNISSQPVEVSLTNARTGGVYAEIDVVGPGVTRPMQVDVGSGAYAFQCDASAGQLIGPTRLIPGNVPDSEAVIPASVANTLTAVASEKSSRVVDGVS